MPLEIVPAALLHRGHGAVMVSEFDLTHSLQRDLKVISQSIAQDTTGQADKGGFLKRLTKPAE
ncbi:hypothetical protein, partial [Teichococcus coralli]|uniref:hypothetical protein n=1 Tax=Teichococcus coralli TaxID=2545983 RepID=UPI001F364984